MLLRKSECFSSHISLKEKITRRWGKKKLWTKSKTQNFHDIQQTKNAVCNKKCFQQNQTGESEHRKSKTTLSTSQTCSSARRLLAKKFSTKSNLAEVSTRGYNNVEHQGYVFKCFKAFVGTCVEKKTNFSNWLMKHIKRCVATFPYQRKHIKLALLLNWKKASVVSRSVPKEPSSNETRSRGSQRCHGLLMFTFARFGFVENIFCWKQHSFVCWISLRFWAPSISLKLFLLPYLLYLSWTKVLLTTFKSFGSWHFLLCVKKNEQNLLNLVVKLGKFSFCSMKFVVLDTHFLDTLFCGYISETTIEDHYIKSRFLQKTGFSLVIRMNLCKV